jgi:hypothetical protein
LTGATWFDTLVPIKSEKIIDMIFHNEKPANEIGEELITNNQESSVPGGKTCLLTLDNNGQLLIVAGSAIAPRVMNGE